ncbi:aspartate-semialdehyde dehydrogenase [Candidatus Methanoplasma termitum]|uniref:Asd1 protein n=1 Tax=Candidatus Methanoplasma termitum TaxID=1577791 RepID=A0A0A7LAQ5_9ARCH|nr:aspartate-semialdehyde dehydrogenase [Candidatus Methanoplasma termitum]AIZ56144.1 aspartate-semialdehyde dehydrogenase [Candidatus Methanoplasma termitum]MCL2333467.1 aspartate-semialdehyde dehydrogenase [Candidatus Methanoplasma sp.]
MSKISVAVLGATGPIGQRFVQMLEDHPYFEIEGLYASERSEGKKFRDTIKIRDHEFSEEAMETKIKTMDLKHISKNVRIAFSGLPSDLAGPTETELAKKGVAVFSNAGSHRMDAHVPIIIPEVNPDHAESVKQQDTYKDGGYIVTNANCSSTGIAVPLFALDKKFGLEEVFVSTYQALSGAGYPGVASLDAVGNVIPFINQEEEKMEKEIGKIIGSYSPKGGFKYADFKVMANCARVPVIDGHTEALVIKMRDAPSLEDVSSALSKFKGEPQKLKLPSAPRQPVIVRTEKDRPQPVYDVLAGSPNRAKGMVSTVGRIRVSNGYYKMFVLSHNTIRGGAGGSMLNAELFKAKGIL